MRRFIFSIIIFTSLAITSCTLGNFPFGSGGGGAKDPNLELWESHATEVYKIDQNFSPTENQDIVYYLTVVNGEVELVIDTNIYISTEIFILPDFYSIEDMFEIIASVPNNRPYRFEVEYDSVYGYPTYIFYDSTVSRNNDFFYINTKLAELDAEKPFSYDKRKEWEELEITEYKFEQNWICFCPLRSALLTVKDNLIESGIKLPDSTTLTLQEARDNFVTIDNLFNILDQAFALDLYEVMTVVYDTNIAYPRNIYIDQYLHVADDEYNIVSEIKF